jgi:hypothetical protein
VLQAAVDGLLKALAGWRIIAVHFAQVPHDQAQQQVAIVSRAAPNELRPGFQSGDPAGWLGSPVAPRRIYEQGVAALNVDMGLRLPVAKPEARFVYCTGQKREAIVRRD